VCQVEALFIFSLVQSVAGAGAPNYVWRANFQSKLADMISAYIAFRVANTKQKFTAASYPFAMQLQDLLRQQMSTTRRDRANLTIFDFCYDYVNSKWVQWTNLTMNESDVISGNMSTNILDNKEIVRLNP